MGIGVSTSSALIYVGLMIVLLILGFSFVRIFKASTKIVFKLFLNSVIAGGLLYGFNHLFSFLNFSIPMTLPVIFICAILGVPGFVIVFFITFLF